MKHGFYVLVVRQVALDNVPLKMALVLKNLACSEVRNDQKYLNKMIDCVGERIWNVYKATKWPVLYCKCIGKINGSENAVFGVLPIDN